GTSAHTFSALTRASGGRRAATKGSEPVLLSGSLSEAPMPIRSGAMQRPSGCKCGNTLRQRYDEVGLPCSSTMGSPSPTSTYAISLPKSRRRCLWYGNAAEIKLPSPLVVVAVRAHERRGARSTYRVVEERLEARTWRESRPESGGTAPYAWPA